MNEYFGFGSNYIAVIWLFSILTFVVYYLRDVLHGKAMTIVSYVLIFNILIPILINYPFAYSELNSLSTGVADYYNYLDYLDNAFLISLVGILSLTAGLLIPIKFSGKSFLLSFFEKGIRFTSSYFNVVLAILVLFLLFGIFYKMDLLSLKGARHEAMEQPALRPIFNLVHILLPLLTSIFFLLAFEKKRKFVLFILPLLILLGLLTGTRAGALGGILIYAITVIICNSLRKKVNFRFFLIVFISATGLLFLAVFLGELRKGEYNLVTTFLKLGTLILYGNNFSDLRDFAWILSYWDGEFIFGKTQLAGILSFIPSSLFQFRQDWSWGVFSTSLVGLNSETHAGLRPGIFGEFFFNFGYPGVIISGFLFGLFINKINLIMNNASKEVISNFDLKVKILAAIFSINFVWNFLITGGFFGVYLMLLIFLMLNILSIATTPHRNTKLQKT